MKREEILKSPDYWTTSIQIELFRCAVQFMKEKGFNRKQLADYLGVSRSYVTQLLNGDYDHRLSKLVSLALAFGYVPNMEFKKVDYFIELENYKSNEFNCSFSIPEYHENYTDIKIYDNKKSLYIFDRVSEQWEASNDNKIIKEAI